MSKSLTITRILLAICIIYLIPGAIDSPRDKNRNVEGVNASMRELIRIPLTKVNNNSTYHFRAYIPRSILNEQNLGLGPRFYQASLIVEENNSQQVLPWDSESINILIRQNSKTIQTHETKTTFYLHRYPTDTITGLAFNLEPYIDCDFEITISNTLETPNAELVIAPNWPNSRLLKDSFVTSMLESDLDMIQIWCTRIALALSSISLFILFRSASTS